MMVVIKISKVLRAGLTDKERKLLDAIIITGSLSLACARIKITESSGHQRLYRLRQRNKRAQALIEEYNVYKYRITGKVGVYL